MTRAHLAALASALAILGCGPSSRHSAPTAPSAQAGSLAISYVGSISPAQRAACASAIAAVASEWSAREPAPLPAVVVYVHDPAVALTPGSGFAGWSDNGRGRIEVVAWYPGYEWSCPALYHELAHYAYGLRGHSDPRWGSWDATSWALGLAWARPDLPPP